MLSLQDLHNFYRISRPGNVLMTCLSLCLGAYIAKNHSFIFFKHTIFWAITIATMLIAAGGYWINDAYDFRIDRINKPDKAIVNTFLSVKKVTTSYIVLNVIVLLGAVFFVKKLILILLGAILLLFFYAVYLKRSTLVGNILVAFLASLVLMMAGFIYTFNIALIWTAIFAFEITLIREIVKDTEDIKGDFAFGLQTLPIQIGIKKTKYVLYGLAILFEVSCMLPTLFHFINSHKLQSPYCWVSVSLVQIPFLYVIKKLIHANSPQDFTHISRYLKYMMLAGMVSTLML